MLHDEFRCKILLNMIPDIGPIRANRLLEHFGSAQKVFNSSPEELGAVAGIASTLAGRIIAAPGSIDIEQEIERAEKYGVHITVPEHEDYPVPLKNITDPPIVLYYKGSFIPEDIFAVAVVGTRKPTSYGKMAAERFVKELSGLGVTIVSGLARGIDTCAHWAALTAKGRTLAVLGNGLSVHYPPENRKLEQTVISAGALISEFPITMPPDKMNFPRRNRLIAALSLGTVVVEADIKSGALITARFAAEQGKDVFAVPGSIFSKYSLGPHRLLKQGARLVESAGDIVEEIMPLAEWITRRHKRMPEKKELPVLDVAEQEILENLEKEPQGVHIDRLQTMLKKPFGELSRTLVSLELKSMVKSLPGKIYLKV